MCDDVAGGGGNVEFALADVGPVSAFVGPPGRPWFVDLWR